MNSAAPGVLGGGQPSRHLVGMTLEFREARVDSGPGGALVDAMRAEMADAFLGLVLDGSEMPAAGHTELGPPHGAFIIGWSEGEAICCCGFKRPSDGGCEIKRMYANPVATFFGEKSLS